MIFRLGNVKYLLCQLRNLASVAALFGIGE